MKFDIIIGLTKFDIKRVRDWKTIADRAIKENRDLTDEEWLELAKDAPIEELKKIQEAINERNKELDELEKQ